MDNRLSSPTKENLLVRSLLISVGLIAFKLAVFVGTNSIAILTSAVDSGMDLLVSAANYILMKSSTKPADHNHPYGHGKIESLAGLAQSLIIGGVVVAIAAMAVRRFMLPEPIQQPLVGIGVSAVALVLTLWHTRNLRSAMLSTHSQVMATEYLHYASDTFMYLGVLMSFVLFKITGQTFWDPLLSLLMVVYLLKTILDIFRETLTELLDVQLPDSLLKEIDALILTFDSRIESYHDLRTRKVGPTKFIEFHVVLRNVETFRDAHHLTVGLMETFQKRFPGAVVTVHADPA
ncbi:MAG: Ferrous-iron efflux pump FieF [Elusimicrobia bacterium]|nr:Ferrous-iron efflux pump FieF [Elusimicrobiota bacterium]